MNTISSTAPPVLRKRWGWFLALGILLVAIGIAALGSTVAATLVSVIALGAFLFFGGIAETLVAFGATGWRGFLVDLVTGILMALVGFGFMTRPLLGSAALTMILAILFLVGGAGRIAVAAVERYTGWGIAVASGVLSILLGSIIYAQYPESSLWFIGMAVGLELMFRGARWIALALGVRSISKRFDDMRHAA